MGYWSLPISAPEESGRGNAGAKKKAGLRQSGIDTHAAAEDLRLKGCVLRGVGVFLFSHPKPLVRLRMGHLFHPAAASNNFAGSSISAGFETCGITVCRTCRVCRYS